MAADDDILHECEVVDGEGNHIYLLAAATRTTVDFRFVKPRPDRADELVDHLNIN